MKKLICVRYGEHENGRLNEEGKKMMLLVSEKLRPILENKKTAIICAKVPRAIEGAEIIAKNLNTDSVQSFQELYAALEEDIEINLGTAKSVIEKVSEGNDIIIAVISREYIEALPNYLLGIEEKVELNRGEALVLDSEAKTITYIK